MHLSDRNSNHLVFDLRHHHRLARQSAVVIAFGYLRAGKIIDQKQEP
jgi:hypothetical protein